MKGEFANLLTFGVGTFLLRCCCWVRTPDHAEALPDTLVDSWGWSDSSFSSPSCC